MGAAEEIADAIARLRVFDTQVDVHNRAKMEAATLYILRYAKMFCPVDEGALRADISNIVVQGADGVHGRVYATLFYAPYVHQGTGIYAIDGNGRKTPWVWKGDGGKYDGYHRTVGQRAQPFITDAVVQNITAIEGIFGGTP